MNQERYPISSITDVELEAIVRAIDVKEPAAKVGHPRHYSDLSLLRFHVYRFGKGGWSVRRMLRELRRDKKLLEVLAMKSIPSLSTISERSKRLAWQELWQREGNGRYLLALDASALEGFRSDPDGCWGIDGDEQWFYGYKLYLVFDVMSGEVLAVELAAANRNESPVGRELLKQLPKGEGVILADAAYDAEANHHAALARGYQLLTAVNPRNGKPRQAARQLNKRLLDMPGYRALYRWRFEIERALSILKNILGLTPLRVRGMAAVKRHVLAAVTAFTVIAQALTKQGLSMHLIAQVAA